MIGRDAFVDLMRRFVFLPGEVIEWEKAWPDRIWLHTNERGYDAESAKELWPIAQEPWAEDLILVEQDTPITEGWPYMHGFLLLRDGGAVYLNDERQVAELGRRLNDGMNPLGYAQVLVWWHPWGSAPRAVVGYAGELRDRFHRDDLPDLGAPSVWGSPDGMTVRFHSWETYDRMVNVYSWTVRAPRGEPARWEREKIVDRWRLHQPWTWGHLSPERDGGEAR